MYCLLKKKKIDMKQKYILDGHSDATSFPDVCLISLPDILKVCVKISFKNAYQYSERKKQGA